MRKKLQQKAIAVAGTLLRLGEQAELASRCRVGMASLGSQAMSAVVSAITSASASVSVDLQLNYVVLTNQRLIVMPSHWLTFVPQPKIAFSIPRAELVVGNVKRGFMTSFDVRMEGSMEGARLAFARTERGEALRLLAALGLPA